MLEILEVQEKQEEKVWLVPMPSRSEIITDKKVDYGTVGALMLESKRHPRDQQAGTRYLYLGSISGENLTKFCEYYSLAKSTTRRNISALKKLDAELLEVFEVNSLAGRGEVVYRIQFADKDNKYFVRVPSNTLKDLVTSYKSPVIKIFCHMLWILRDNKKNKYVQRFVPLSYIAEQLKCNVDTAGRHMKALVRSGCITVDKVWEVDIDGNTICKNYYRISADIVRTIESIDAGEKSIPEVPATTAKLTAEEIKDNERRKAEQALAESLI